jgi:nitroimidazol reductase NimA-like FMN-containing flavoprotein (pyridoxamine 5'-phosphate oxidase superfamily)
MLDRMKALVKEKGTCVLATVSGQTPHCSLMAYAADDECREIYMVTHKGTTKFKNLTENPTVSLLIDTREDHSGSRLSDAKAMTIDGIFEKIEDGPKIQDARSRLLRRHPHLQEFLDHPDAEILCIKVGSFLLLDGLTDAHYEKV